MLADALRPGTERTRRLVAALFAAYLLAVQAGPVVAGVGSSNPGP